MGPLAPHNAKHPCASVVGWPGFGSSPTWLFQTLGRCEWVLHLMGREVTQRTLPHPKGPKIEEIQDRPPGLKFSIEIENFKRATTKPLVFVGNSEGPGLKISSEIEIFSIEIENSNRDRFFSIFGPLGY